ncbi:DUF6933 domain-containing protein, partial [Novilysobacter arseniciresistens]|uniref:DUF6933 domain-containing protein n=1 Tax=Novilysobacter arseniciresistens TaxID=1385522 RepID=UPI001269FD7C
MADLIVTRAIAARARIKRDNLGAPEETDAPLGNWYVTFLPMAERNAFVYMSSRTQMSFLMLEGERLTPEKLFVSLIRGISLVLELAGFPECVRERVMNGYRSVALARASDLSMLGVLTNCALDYEAFIEQDGGLNRCNLDHLVIEMNCRPAKKLGFKTPLEETAIALGVQPNNSFKPNLL